MNVLWEEPGYPPFFEEPPDLEECRRSPLWMLGEGAFDDEDIYAPVQITDPLLVGKEEHLALFLFVFCAIRLGDGTQLDGVVYLGQLYAPELKSEYGLDVFYEGETISVPPKGVREITKTGSPEAFARRIGKRLHQISPLTWTTPYRVRVLNDRFPTGVSAEYALAGQIDLLTW